MINALGRRFYYGWWVAGAAATIEFANAATAISILTIFVVPMTEELRWSRTEISAATSLGAVLGAALAPFTGRLVDRVGSRLVLAGGGAVVAVACLFLSMTTTLWGFYAAFTCSRVADQGLIKIGATTAAGKWFSRYRGRAVSLVFFGAALGVIIMAPLIQLVISYWDWRAAWAMLAVIMLLLGVIPSALLVRRQPEDLGLTVDGLPPPASSLSASDSSPALPSAAASARGEEQWPLGEVVRTPTFWLVLVSLFVGSSSSSGVGLHLMPHFIQQGLNATAAVGAISVMFTAGAAGALGLGVLSERISPRLMLSLAYLLASGGMVVLILADNLAEAYLFAIIQGVAGSGANTLAPILWARYYGRDSLGSIYGLSRAAQVSGFALGPLLSGIIYDATGVYRGAFVYFAILGVVSALLLLAARRPVRRAR